MKNSATKSITHYRILTQRYAPCQILPFGRGETLHPLQRSGLRPFTRLWRVAPRFAPYYGKENVDVSNPPNFSFFLFLSKKCVFLYPFRRVLGVWISTHPTISFPYQQRQRRNRRKKTRGFLLSALLKHGCDSNVPEARMFDAQV
jgi:hypothetical protein